MMKFKKFLAAAMTGAMMLGVVAAAAPTVAVYATDPADEDKTEDNSQEGVSQSGKIKLEIDYSNYMATITTTGDDTFLFLGVLKEGKNGNPDTESATYCYPLAGDKKAVTVDLSFLSPKKTQKLRAYGNIEMKEDAAVTTVAAQTTKISVKYKYTTSNTGAGDWWKDLTIRSGSDTVTIGEQDALKAYSYRTQYSSNWETLDQFDFANANIAGTTIIVRAEEKDGDGNLTAPASAEVKVKIPAIAKAPKITVDYVKGTVKITDKQEYDLVDAAGKVSYAKTGTKTAIDIEKDLGLDENKDIVLAVRTKETSSKPASNPTFIKLKAALKPDDTVKGTVSVTVDEKKYTLTYELSEDGKDLILKGAGFEYKKDEKDTNWTKVKDTEAGTTIRSTTSAIVRLQGSKTEERLPSLSVTVAPSAEEEEPGDDDEV